MTGLSETDLSDAKWCKAIASAVGNCAEIASLPGAVGIRDSKSPEKGAHVITRPAFAQFLSDAKSGRFDLK
jgi:hypothetical protein